MTAPGQHDPSLLFGICARILKLVGERAEAEVTVSSGRSALTRFANSFIHQNVAEDGQWARVKVIADGRIATAGTSLLVTGLDAMVERALDAARFRPVDPDWPGLAPPMPAPPTPDGVYDPDTHIAPPQARAEVVRQFVAAGADSGDGVALKAAGYCQTGGHEVAFANSAGQQLWGHTTRAVIEGIHRTADADAGGQQVAARIGDLDGAATGRRAAGKARRSVELIDVEPGDWEVVLEPNSVVDVLACITGHGFNAKHHAEGRSFVHLGEQQMDPSLSIFDDALDPRIIGLPFDAEGTPRRRLDLVQSGVSAALCHDRRTAGEAGTESTGHAVPGGEMAGPIPNHVFLQPGERTPEDIVAGVERGLLVTDFWYTRILDPKTTVVTGLTRNGTFLIENGQVTKAVRNLRFTQSYIEALAPGNVVAVGNDGRLAGESQFFAPTVHLKSWHFSGGAKG
ncbi:MAG: TldD/PmbA family protein [Acidimicrobiales bacterium]